MQVNDINFLIKWNSPQQSNHHCLHECVKVIFQQETQNIKCFSQHFFVIPTYSLSLFAASLKNLFEEPSSNPDTSAWSNKVNKQRDNATECDHEDVHEFYLLSIFCL